MISRSRISTFLVLLTAYLSFTSPSLGTECKDVVKGIAYVYTTEGPWVVESFLKNFKVSGMPPVISEPEPFPFTVRDYDIQDGKQITITDSAGKFIGHIQYGKVAPKILYVQVVRVKEDFQGQGVSTYLLARAVLDTLPEKILTIFTGDNEETARKALVHEWNDPSEIREAVEQAPFSKSMDTLGFQLFNRPQFNIAFGTIEYGAFSQKAFPNGYERKNKN